MKKELSAKSRRNIYVGAWFFIIFQFMALLGSTGDSQQRDPIIESFLQYPTLANIGITIAFLLGGNMLAIGALIAGLALWRHDIKEEGKTIIVAAIVAISLGIILAF
ncbi:MAG: hypothetical protein CEE38_17385 [Planctomycetes bacterium B3_Pla]|nr:MAG: hypothetical protein CEE38_17385 [Planctomycetes bacterium B3_Pla]